MYQKNKNNLYKFQDIEKDSNEGKKNKNGNRDENRLWKINGYQNVK